MADTPLAQLDPDAQQALAELGDSLADLDSDERTAVAELAQARADGDVSRRGLLKAAGAIGAGALVGGGSAAALTGDAQAADTGTGQIGEAGNPQDLYLDRVLDDGGDLVADLDDTGDLVFQNRGLSGLSSVDTEQTTIEQTRNGRAIYREGGEYPTLADAFNAVSESDADIEKSGLVELDPFAGDNGGSESFYQFTDDTFPITIPRGVTFDIRGAYIRLANSDVAFELEDGVTILGAGAAFDIRNSGDNIFRLDGDKITSTTNYPTQVLGHPHMIGGSGPAVYRLVQENGGTIASAVLTATGRNMTAPLDVESNGGSGYINNCTFSFQGSTDAGSKNIYKLYGTGGAIRYNRIYSQGLQVKSGSSFIFMDFGKNNKFIGNAADPASVSNSAIVFSFGAGPWNAVESGAVTGPDVVNNSGEHQVCRQPNGQGMLPFDLSGMTGDFEGYVAMDDGTNTTGGGLQCTWIGSAWQPSDGSSTFS